MDYALGRLQTYLCTVLLTAAASIWGTETAEQATVSVLDRKGNPVSGVYVLIETAAPAAPVSSAPYVMDQVDMAFSPAVLIVPTGAPVSFPNSDIVAHHVYSFSKPNQFTLPLYRGEIPNPIAFEHEGIVVLGCNIHDHMIAHILVSDRTVVGQTDELGELVIGANPADVHSVQIFSPRFRANAEQLIGPLDANGHATFQLTKRLRPAPTQISSDIY